MTVSIVSEPDAIGGGYVENQKVNGTTTTNDEVPKKKNLLRRKLGSICGKLMQNPVFSAVWIVARLLLFVVFLYLFICSLSLMSDAFRLLAGKNLGVLFRENSLLTNPVVDLMIGVLVTMLIHSSATTTAVMISMAASNVIPIDQAIYVVFGSEIGTSITSCLVSIGQIGNRDEFRRAFSGSTIHSVYNWLSVLLFFPLEVSFHMLRRIAEAIVGGVSSEGHGKTMEFLSAIIKPLTQKLIQLDSDLVNEIAAGTVSADNVTTLIKRNGSFAFAHTTLSDQAVGGILLPIVLLVLCCCLTGVAKTMSSLLGHKFAETIRLNINKDLPGRWRHLTGYLFIVIGAVMTAIIQSSTVFTSTLTPMVGLGVISVNRVFPLILGANIGTTADSILAALAQDARAVRAALTVALVQVLFNVLGVVIFYPLPFMRRIVIDTGKWLGKQTCNYRWFALVYISVLFVLLPVLAIALSMAGPVVTYVFAIPLAIFALLIVIVNAIQTQRPQLLPSKYRTWDWLPAWMHSLEPYDRCMARMCCSCCRRFLRKVNTDEDIDDGKRISAINNDQELVARTAVLQQRPSA